MINKVQSSNVNFGTKVLLDKGMRQVIAKALPTMAEKRKFLGAIQNAAKDGHDSVTLTMSNYPAGVRLEAPEGFHRMPDIAPSTIVTRPLEALSHALSEVRLFDELVQLRTRR